MPRPLRILVAEDSPDDVSLLEHAFSRAGVEVPIRFVHDGQEAIDYLQRKPPFNSPAEHPEPTLLLLDLKMPRLNGFEVLKWLRRHPSLRRLLIVVYSASEDPGDMQRAYALGADSYVIKPQTPEEVIDVVRDMEQYWLRLNATPECDFAED